jgi:hypothetical protein
MKKFIGQFITEQQEDALGESLVEEIEDKPMTFEGNFVTREEMELAIEEKTKEILKDFREITSGYKKTMGGGKYPNYFDAIESELRKRHFKTGY